MLTAKDIMTTNVVTIDPGATVAEAMDRIRSAGIRCLIVEKRSPGGSYGIVTQRDIAYKVLAEGLDARAAPVHAIMTCPLITIGEEMAVRDVAGLMRLTGLSRLVVMYRGALQGVVSVSDIIAAA